MTKLRKLVNGKIVDIKNVDIFEKAAEGAAINRTLPNIIPNEGLSIDFEAMENFIEIYKRFYVSLPFPLYSVDSDLKYCSAGLFIKKESATKNAMWTDNGLFISMDDERKLALGFVNNSWGIVKVNEIKPDNLNIQEYREEIGFEDFVWVTASLFKKEGTSDYYKLFMSKFVEACGNQPVVMRWELSNILQFVDIPDKITLQPNKIINLESKSEITLDIFTAGVREQRDRQQQVWSFVDGQEDSISYKKTKVYGYDLYEKPNTANKLNVKAGSDKIRTTEIFGINSLFCTLCSIKSATEAENFAEYSGFISDGNFVYLIDNRLFIAKANVYTEAKEVARGVEIYAYKPGVVYIAKQKMIAAGVRKDIIYSYSIADGNLRMCKILFTRV